MTEKQPPNVPDLSNHREVDHAAAINWTSDLMSQHIHPLLSTLCRESGGDPRFVSGLVGHALLYQTAAMCAYELGQPDLCELIGRRLIDARNQTVRELQAAGQLDSRKAGEA